MGKGKAKYPETLRFRAPTSFKKRLLTVLEKRGYGDESELMREAVIKWIEAEEQRLGIEKKARPAPPQG